MMAGLDGWIMPCRNLPLDGGAISFPIKPARQPLTGPLALADRADHQALHWPFRPPLGWQGFIKGKSQRLQWNWPRATLWSSQCAWAR